MKKKIHDKTFVPFLSAADIQQAVSRMAAQINKDYQGKSPLCIAILNGSFMFAADLFKQLEIDASISFIKLASYKGMHSTGNVVTAIGLETTMSGRDIILIEDIVDTGKTLHAFLPQIMDHQPASLKICSLLHKKEATVYPIKIDYLGFEIPNLFVVGYGLDYDGLGRNLSQIMQLES
ncbi:MAG: hypoxanthine phosphoribosyltransferase [Bacteroidota bacterium]|jgi:hypoxanthine phosphoribosyltransferase|nr:hypoxanthine phosphoribosyltransferase [Chitinophagaceae bacterium]